MSHLKVGVNDLESLRSDLVKYWHPSLNKELKPCDVTSRSTKKCGGYVKVDIILKVALILSIRDFIVNIVVIELYGQDLMILKL